MLTRYRSFFYFSVVLLTFIVLPRSEANRSTAEAKECHTLECLHPTLRVYFSMGEISIHKPLIEAIDNAKESISAYFYQCNDESIRDALLRAKKRGVEIRFITDATYYNKEKYFNAFYSSLEEAGVTVITEEDSGKKDANLHAHNKFAVLDEKIVWTGSYNITINGRERNNNNAIWVANEALAQVYLTEFNQVWGNGSERSSTFGNKKEAAISFPKTQIGEIDNLEIEALFSPTGHSKALRKAIKDVIESADESIYFASFMFTDSEIAEAIVEKAKKGVQVYGIFNVLGAGNRYSAYKNALSKGQENITVYVHNKKEPHAKTLHHKFLIVDPDTDSDPTVVTGSSNWTDAAWKKNDENTLIIYNGAVARAFLKEFKQIFPEK